MKPRSIREEVEAIDRLADSKRLLLDHWRRAESGVPQLSPQ